jgi:hypothetical protein
MRFLIITTKSHSLQSIERLAHCEPFRASQRGHKTEKFQTIFSISLVSRDTMLGTFFAYTVRYGRFSSKIFGIHSTYS